MKAAEYRSAYGQQTTYHIGDRVPLVLDGVTVAVIDVQDILP
jgi:hypothetical protein